SRFEAGKQYPIHARKKGTLQAAEEILLDGNALAQGHSFYAIGSYEMSPNGQLLVWGDDTVGRNEFVLHVKDLKTGKVLPDTAVNISPNFAWASDNKTLFYVGKDPTTLRSDRVFRQTLGGAAEQIFKEDDGQYYVGLQTTKSRKYIAIGMSATTNSEVRLIDADRPRAEPTVFLPRSRDHLYSLDHLDGRFVVLSNADAKNFRLFEVALGKQADRKAWRDLVPHAADVLLEDFALYRRFLAVSVRSGGLRKVKVLPKGKAAFFIDAPDPTYAMTVVNTPDPDSAVVRYEYDSLTAPSSVLEQQFTGSAATLLKRQPVPGYQPELYASDYLHATAKDGAKIPISVVYKKSTPRDGTAPILIMGYGSYGFSMEPWFEQTRVSLLDRGWIFAIAHVRGGQELGRAWYEDGKLSKKMNTFTDFIAVSEHLVEHKVAAAGRVYATGGSAGGLLMGAIANLRPELYRGIIAAVPFVDVVTTMLDESIPLTTNEFDEWGNPGKDKAAYDAMLAYSPYDNVGAKAYPSMYVRTGLHDSQVQYFEPAKWVARLRTVKTDRNPLLFETDMTSGHGGSSGRFNRLRRISRELAFLLFTDARPDARTPAR
ncbi:MAG TPA: S9 family peptidase, partial [Kofleriaceae bacterium]|nr:S9 family peptidase [Kofleriaceae bacterium]